MTERTVKEPRPETAVGAAGWAQDQLYEVKGRVGQLEQQLEQLRSTSSAIAESVRGVEGSLRELALNAAQVPRLQEELNQAVALIMQLQDQHAEARERIDALSRQRETEEDRDQQEWTEVAKRTEQLERQVALWQDRQAGVDEVGRRFQEGLSLLRQQLQQAEQRLEATESKAARSLEGANRAEQTLSQVQGSILELGRQDETIGERARATAEVVHRLDTALNDNLRELQRVEMLAERIELHRAERQRLEDRALRMEEGLTELQQHYDKLEHERGRMSGQQQGLAS
ncbi:MAG: hypothetical protein Q8S13_00720, partial [Dehalococcoidia bacterium]|nr:hypothetical protein [Dehalococcoidia bacterium]